MRAIKFIIVLSTFWFFDNHLYSQKATPKTDFINPTGFYKLSGEKKGDETYGYYGFVKVKMISKTKIVIRFFICKGYKSYSSGSFYDTLSYHKNISLFGPTEFDPSCKVQIKFTSNGLRVDENTSDFNSGCGFGHAIVAKDYFKKVSKRTPTDMDLATED